MISRSYWEDRAYIGSPDFLIIGAGLVGLFTAWFLKQKMPDSDILVIERGPFSSGASTKNAGFATFGTVSEILEDLGHIPEAEVIETISLRWNGLQVMRQILGDEAIDFSKNGGFEIFPEGDMKFMDTCRQGMDVVNKLVQSATGMPSIFQWQEGCTPGLHNIAGSIHNAEEGSLDTGKLNVVLNEKCRAAGIRFLFGMEVEMVSGEPDPRVDIRGLGAIFPHHIILATNAFTDQLTGGLDVRAVRNQVLVTKPLAGLNLQGCYHMDCGYYYFRTLEDNRLLVGGGRHHLGEKENTAALETSREAFTLLSSMVRKYIYPGIKENDFEYHWSGILGIGNSKKPIICQVNPGLFAAVRMGGMGVAISSEVGRRLALMIENNAN